jgi:hypothetical protein
MIAITSGETLGDIYMPLTVTPDDSIICRNISILSITPVFYFVIPPIVSPLVIVTMYHLATTPKSF